MINDALELLVVVGRLGVVFQDLDVVGLLSFRILILNPVFGVTDQRGGWSNAPDEAGLGSGLQGDALDLEHLPIFMIFHLDLIFLRSLVVTNLQKDIGWWNWNKK